MSGPQPPPTGSTVDDLAPVLRGIQADLLASCPGERPGSSGQVGADPIGVRQTGAAILPEPFPVPVPNRRDPVAPRNGEPVIETFMIDGSAAPVATGGDRTVADWWQPTVDALVDRVRAAMASAGVALTGPISITASATDLDQVVAEPHLDDDQYHPEAGVGLVAIAASHRGPRVAGGMLGCRLARPGAPLGLDPSSLLTWFDGDEAAEIQLTPPDRVVLFPRFGQLHAGPVDLEHDRSAGEIRNLLVLRADTAPGQTLAGSGPT